MFCHLDFALPVTDNARLNQTASEFEAPVMLYSTIESDGYGECHLSSA